MVRTWNPSWCLISPVPDGIRLAALDADGEDCMGLVAGLYGLICYAFFLVTFLYSIAFVADANVPKTIDFGGAAPAAEALLVNAMLLGLFAVQHSVMARPWFKALSARLVPRSIERSTYVLLSSLLLALLYWKWLPMPAVVWDFESPIARDSLLGLSALGWLLVLTSTFMINHFDLFGLRQVYLRARGRSYTPLMFTEALLYRVVRHPIMLGFIIAFWATPHMSAGHLLFAVATTAYIVVGISLEERDLMRSHGPEYGAYRDRVPMLLPAGKWRTPKPHSADVQQYP
jgi:methanethiol S-methyltransferase